MNHPKKQHRTNHAVLFVLSQQSALHQREVKGIGNPKHSPTAQLTYSLISVILGSVDTKIIHRFSSKNFMQARRKGAGRLSPVKPF